MNSRNKVHRASYQNIRNCHAKYRHAKVQQNISTFVQKLDNSQHSPRLLQTPLLGVILARSCGKFVRGVVYQRQIAFGQLHFLCENL